jgi:hypothetical protein
MMLSRAPIIAALMIVMCQATAKVARENAVFCSATTGAQVLAIATTPEGRLRFGISVWSPEGSNISVFGVADPAPAGWRYAETNGRCVIDFIRNADGGFTVRADAIASCSQHGGSGARIGTLRFTPAQDEGPVTTELDDAEAFQHAGHCAGGH